MDEAEPVVAKAPPGVFTDVGVIDGRSTAIAQLASYEVPREIHLVAEIPKNLVGKPLRRVIRERLASTPPPAT